MIRVLLVLVGVLALAACRGQDEDVGPSGGVGGARPAPPASVTCPECSGTGLCPECCAPACPLCASDGGCVFCAGDPDGCRVCEGTGDCVLCLAAAPEQPPGLCARCEIGSGECLECGGAGRLPGDFDCALCGGLGRCPDCLGHGLHPGCFGAAICPTCAGHGSIAGAAPGSEWPVTEVLLREGGSVTGRVISATGSSLTIVPKGSGTTSPHSLLRDRVDPLSFWLELSRHGVGDALDSYRRLAELDPGLSALVRVFLTRRKGESALVRAALTEITRDLGRSTYERAVRALETGREPRRAWALLSLVRQEFPHLRGRELDARLELAAEQTRSIDAGLAGPARVRRAEAEAGRLTRITRRCSLLREHAAQWISGAEATVHDARRTATLAVRVRGDAARTVNRAPPDLDSSAALREARAALELENRARILLAARLLESGHVHRARALASNVLRRSPGDSGAARFIAVVEEALARRAVAEEENR